MMAPCVLGHSGDHVNLLAAVTPKYARVPVLQIVFVRHVLDIQERIVHMRLIVLEQRQTGW